MSTSYNHPPFSGEPDPPTTLHGHAVNCSFNTHSQHQKAAEGHACPPAQTDLAATVWSPSTLHGHDALYRNYHYSGKNASPDSHKIPFTSKSSLPLGLFRVPKRWHKVRLAPYTPLPPIEKFVPRPTRLHPVEIWRVGGYDWQKPATTVPAMEYRDIGGARWRWPSLGEVFKWITGGKHGKAA